MKIYTASSWRNEEYPDVVKTLRNGGYEVFDFQDPACGRFTFHWAEVDPNYASWTPEQYMEVLLSEIYPRRGFDSDFDGMKWADVCVLVLPCGRSAHLEAGWFVGQGKPCHILLSEKEFQPDLMYLMATAICPNIETLLGSLKITKQILKIWSK